MSDFFTSVVDCAHDDPAGTLLRDYETYIDMDMEMVGGCVYCHAAVFLGGVAIWMTPAGWKRSARPQPVPTVQPSFIEYLYRY